MPARRVPAFVKLAPGDSGEGLLDAFFQHPRDFRPHIDPKDGKIESWGLYPYETRSDEPLGFEAGFLAHMQSNAGKQMMRQMSVQQYYYGPNAPRDPELQFVDALIQKKKEALGKADVADLRQSDYIMKIEMTKIPNAKGENRIWRRFRCSGGITLATLADKVIIPVMGWVRNYHAYLFQDWQDGSVYGPHKCDSIDMMHMANFGWGYLPDNKWCLAHLVQKEGLKVGWVYDLGDKWEHMITVEKICAPNDSTGKVEVLAGSGACPPEDGHGNHNWLEDITKLEKGSSSERREVLERVRGGSNYKNKFNGTKFDSDHFDLIVARKALSDALASPASVMSGAKKLHMPFAPGASAPSMYPPKSGQKVVTTPSDTFGFMQETVSEKRDKSAVAACANCGSPHNLRKCSGCHLIVYCGVACQNAHWKSHKKPCKASQAA